MARIEDQEPLFAPFASSSGYDGATPAELGLSGEAVADVGETSLRPCPSALDPSWSSPSLDALLAFALIVAIGAVLGALVAVRIGRRIERDFEKAMQPLERYRPKPDRGDNDDPTGM